MRLFLAFIVTISFMVGSFANVADAITPDHACTHHAVDHDDHANKKPCHSKQEQNQCDNCCCAHNHTMAAISNESSSLVLAASNQIARLFHDNISSGFIYGLRRPPRL